MIENKIRILRNTCEISKHPLTTVSSQIFVLCRVLPESMHWLVSKRQNEKSKQLFLKIMAVNRIKLADDVVNDLFTKVFNATIYYLLMTYFHKKNFIIAIATKLLSFPRSFIRWMMLMKTQKSMMLKPEV